MNVGFFFVLRTDPQHYLHAASLVADVHRVMPGVPVTQFSDRTSPLVPGATVVRLDSTAPLLDQRLSHYARCGGNWLLVDTDVSVRADVRGVFADEVFDVALCDRRWPHLPQGEQMLHEMPFNTGVVFSRTSLFWVDVLACWRNFAPERQANWMSEQAAVYEVVRTGRYRVKILAGDAYNYPPAAPDAIPPYAALVHYKGERKAWLSKAAVRNLS